jgi:alpha-L-arabinofuranosidase
MFSANQGDYWFDKVITKDEKDQLLAASCVQDSKTGDIILKLVNYNETAKPMKINLGRFGKIAAEAEQIVLAGNPDAENTFENISAIAPTSSKVKISKSFDFSAPAMSLTVIRIKTKK